MKAKFENIQVKAVFLGDKPSFWNPKNYNNSKVSVKNTNTGVKVSFDFWGSIMNPDLATEEDLLRTLNFFMLDVQRGAMEFEDFRSKMGYDVDSIQAKKAWKACKKLLKKAMFLFGDIRMIHEFASKLNEKING
jgi:hypothetical protein